MHEATGAILALAGDRSGNYQALASELACSIAHIQASLRLLEMLAARDETLSDPEDAGDVVVLDDVTPRYMKLSTTLNTCKEGLGAALCSLMEGRQPPPSTNL